MNLPLWLIGFVTTLALMYFSWTARRWWPISYVFAVFFGMGNALLLWTWPEQLRDGYVFVGVVYAVGLPVARVVRRRRQERAEEAEMYRNLVESAEYQQSQIDAQRFARRGR